VHSQPYIAWATLFTIAESAFDTRQEISVLFTAIRQPRGVAVAKGIPSAGVRVKLTIKARSYDSSPPHVFMTRKLCFHLFLYIYMFQQLKNVKKKAKLSCNRPWRPIGL
jgi:hypothetical protein